MIKISPGNTKLGNIPNVSVRPIKDCGPFTPCKDKCYALKAWKQYPNVREAWTHNSAMFHTYPWNAMQSVIEWVYKAKKPRPYFRIHVAGDFFSQNYLDQWRYIASMCPETKFRAFTKNFNLDYSNLPSNLLIGASMWPNWCNPTIPKDLKVKAWVQDGNETRIPKGTFKCLNDCRTCKVCWDNPRDIQFKLH